MERLDRLRLKSCLIGLLLICALMAGLGESKTVYAEELTADISDTLETNEEPKVQKVTDSTAALPADEKIEELPENDGIEPLEEEKIEMSIWRGTGAYEPIELIVGEPLLPQLGSAPETLTNSSGKSVLCEGWQMSGKLIDENVVVTEDLKGGRISPKPHSHTWVSYEEIAATCEEDGWTGGQYCSYERCGIEDPDSPRQMVKALGHKWSTDWTKEKEGHFHSCENGCGEKKDAAAHIPGPEATSLSDQTCTVCGYVMVPAHSHDDKTLKQTAASAADCTTPALKEHLECSLCGKYFESDGQNGYRELTLAEITSAPALGHKFGNWTDSGNGKQVRVCSVCGEREERDKPAAVSGGNNTNQNHGNSGSSSSHKSSDRSGNTGTPSSIVNTGSPQTGDSSNALLWTVLMFLSGSGAVFCIIRKKKVA